MNKMIETIELLNKNNLCIIKIGNFYHAYGKDSFILSYLFNYKIDLFKNECGFAMVSLNKVLAKLEDEKLNYIVIDKRNNYDVELQQDFKNLNKYEAVYAKSKNYVNYKSRVDNINKNLMELIHKQDFRKLLGEVEKLIDERRKI